MARKAGIVEPKALPKQAEVPIRPLPRNSNEPLPKPISDPVMELTQAVLHLVMDVHGTIRMRQPGTVIPQGVGFTRLYNAFLQVLMWMEENRLGLQQLSIKRGRAPGKDTLIMPRLNQAMRSAGLDGVTIIEVWRNYFEAQGGPTVSPAAKRQRRSRALRA